MIKCPRCTWTVRPQATYCANCGVKLVPVRPYKPTAANVVVFSIVAGVVITLVATYLFNETISPRVHPELANSAPLILPIGARDRRIVVAIDHSGFESGLSDLMSAVNDAVEQLGPDRQVAVMWYGDGRVSTPILKPARQESLWVTMKGRIMKPRDTRLSCDAAAAVLEALGIGGGSPDAIVLITDSEIDKGQADEITRLNAGRAAIHVISSCSGYQEAWRRLAARNGGEHIQWSPPTHWH